MGGAEAQLGAARAALECGVSNTMGMVLLEPPAQPLVPGLPPPAQAVAGEGTEHRRAGAQGSGGTQDGEGQGDMEVEVSPVVITVLGGKETRPFGNLPVEAFADRPVLAMSSSLSVKQKLRVAVFPPQCQSVLFCTI